MIPNQKMITAEWSRLSRPLLTAIEKSVTRYWAWYFLLILLMFFSILGPGFLSLRNFQDIIVGSSHLLIVAIGWSFCLISGGMDLSVGYVMALVIVAVARLMNVMYALGVGEPVILAVGILLGISISIIPGWINGFLITRFKAPSFIVTLGMGGIARGLALVVSEGMMIGNLPPLIGRIGNSSFAYLLSTGEIVFKRPIEISKAIELWPFPMWPCLILVIVAYFMLSRTRFGRHVYAIGGKEEAAYRAGVPVDKQKMKVYIFSSFLAGLSGLLYILRFASAAPRAGDSLTLEAVAAVIIGGASLSGGYGSIAGSIVGVLIIGALRTGLVILGVQAYWQFVAVGVVVITAVVIDQFPMFSRRITRKG